MTKKQELESSLEDPEEKDPDSGRSCYEDFDEYPDTREECPVCGELFLDLEGHIAEEQDEDHTVYAVHES
jgi:rubredoxin